MTELPICPVCHMCVSGPVVDIILGNDFPAQKAHLRCAIYAELSSEYPSQQTPSIMKGIIESLKRGYQVY